VRSKQLFRTLKDELTALQSKMLERKREIDRIRSLLDAKAGTRGKTAEEEEVIDEEEFRLMKEDRDAKRQYRKMVSDFKALKLRLSEAKGARVAAQKELLDSFEAWYISQKAAGDTSDDDVLDYGEQFERLQKQRVMDADPDSLAFFNANKSMRNTARQNRTAYKHKMVARRK
jgi:kinesin family protein 6/9